jgi:hypothetical protein
MAAAAAVCVGGAGVVGLAVDHVPALERLCLDAVQVHAFARDES